MSHALAIAIEFGAGFCLIVSTLTIIIFRVGALSDQLFADANPGETQTNREAA